MNYLKNIAAIAILFVCGAVFAEESASSVRFDIRAQTLETALLEFSQQARVQIVVANDIAKGVMSPAVQGEYPAVRALAMLLDGSGLEYRVTDERTIAISAGRPVANAVVGEGIRVAQGETGEGAGGNPRSTESGGEAADAQGTSQEEGGVKLEEIVVTAQKRVENLQDVPVPVTVISAKMLTNTNQLRVQDYYSSIPGISVAPQTWGQSPQITIRGLSTGNALANPTVGIVIDDMPFGSTTFWGGGSLVPDVDPGDLQRIEVLRGPQGTLYGASSLGGLLKFVTVDPSTDAVTGRVQVGTDSVKGTDGFGYSARGSINVPLSDSFAIRASGFSRMDPGYIDNVNTGEDDVNELRGKGGRLAALWRASDAVTLKLSALAQRTESGGSPLVDLQLGDLRQSETARTGDFTTDIQAYSATLTAKLGRVNLISLSGYSVFKSSGAAHSGLGARYLQEQHTKKFTQELRMEMSLGDHIDWLLGAFYADEDSPSGFEGVDFVDATTGAPAPIFVDPTTGGPTSTLVDIFEPGSSSEYAAFTNITFKVTDRFDVQLGGRQAHYKQSLAASWAGPLSLTLFGESPFFVPTLVPEDGAFTYLLTPRFKLSPDMMVYARVATGYRTGSSNSTAASILNVPAIKPDTTINYEVGFKGSFLDQKLTVDASLYYIDWKDIQLSTSVILPGAPLAVAMYVNANSAKSEGLELSLELRPWDGFKLGVWGAWNAAELSEDMPANVLTAGKAGDKLPYSPRFSSHLSVEQAFQIAGTVSAFAGASVSYVGERDSGFVQVDSGLLRYKLPSYVKTDLTAGVRSGNWDVGLYFNNAFDRRGYFSFDPIGNAQPIQPRTIGLNLSKTFF